MKASFLGIKIVKRYGVCYPAENDKGELRL